MNKIIKSICEKKSKIAIIGLGYVGLPLALRFAKAGFKVFGYDTNVSKINSLAKKKSYLETIQNKTISQFVNTSFFPTSDKLKIKKCDIFIICVPTPITKNKTPDMFFIEKSAELIDPFIRKNTIISLESTTYPGTTEDYFLPLITKKNLKPGVDVNLIYSPERIDPGNENFNVGNTPKVLAGKTPACAKIGKYLYEKITKIHLVQNIRTAEFTKLLENIFRSVNIGFVNEMKIIADKLDIDIFETIKAASSKPFGYMPFYPGPGLGGHCIPVDPFILAWRAKEFDVPAKFIELSGEINDQMPKYVVEKCVSILNANNKKVKNSKVIILGVTYKKNSADLRESPSIKIIKLLLEMKAKISLSDKFLPKYLKIKEKKLLNLKFTKNLLKNFDCIILLTDHDYFDYKNIKKTSKLLVDCRGRFEVSSKVIRA